MESSKSKLLLLVGIRGIGTFSYRFYLECIGSNDWGFFAWESA